MTRREIKIQTTKMKFSNLYFQAIFIAIFFTIINKLLDGFLIPIDQIMIYLIGVIIVASRFGKAPSLVYIFLAVSLFNFFFVPPLYSFNVHDQSYWTTFLVMLLTGLVIASQATKLKKQTLSVQKKELEIASEKLKNTLLSSISHDLRTPLTSIIGLSANISELAKNDNSISQIANSIHHQAEKLSHIINNLLEITRLESGNIQIKKELYFIDEVIGAALVRLKTRLQNHQIITNIADNLEMIAIDGSLIEQVIANLLDNAAKYTKEQGIITIFVYQENENMVVVISDSGSGIAVGEEKKIFDKFYTNHQNGIAEKGNGLGLAICQTIINLHHGKIWAKNKIDGGAQFTFTLPIH
jgi:two-component system sensor histidine kinase KdpD